MLCSLPLFVKPYCNRPIFHSIDHSGQEKKIGNFNSNDDSFCYGLNYRPKPIRTCISTNQEKFDHKHQYPKDLNFYDSSLSKEKSKHDEDGFKKTKSRALKKIKQPISPGGRLSSFLSSLFTNGKKTKISSNDEDKKLKSTCSSCGHKKLNMEQQNVEAIKGINKNYVHEDHLKFHKNIIIEDEDDDYDEGASCASSDLFEIDIFSSIGLMGLPL
ncbi:protein BIG GRAIN 1-like A [Solanum pennellii]|uniref:Protein BIG GRAIN 1-like A n=1 Tax=Solanum pennellii TaxID=28526 RepID=A0ABM1FRX3_SOLPN|nr:protein BIG GRAIN 1-like A [Solanum pennellii]